MLTNKIKSQLSYHGIKRSEFAKVLDIQASSLTGKYTLNQWVLSDLVALGDRTNATLCLVDNKTNEIIMKITKEDLKREK